MNIKKGDTVKITAGKDKGKQGKVIKSLPGNVKVVVEGLNLRTKSVRGRKMGEKGQIVRFNAPISASSVMLICPKCSKPVRVGYRLQTNGKKVRICRKCQSSV